MLNMRLVFGMATSSKKALLYAFSLSFKFSRCPNSEMFSRCCTGTSFLASQVAWLAQTDAKQILVTGGVMKSRSLSKEGQHNTYA